MQLPNGSISFDIFESIFFHISRFEEWFCEPDDHNEWDAMQEDQHFLIRNKLQRRPVVDQLLLLLRTNLQMPERRAKSKIVLSHDIDYLKKFTNRFQIFRKIAGHLWRGERLVHLPRLIRDYYKTTFQGRKDPYENLSWLLGQGYVGDKYLFLIVGGQHANDPPIIGDEILNEAVAIGKKNGYKIGLHPSYECHTNPKLLADQYNRLAQVVNKPITYSRQHYLHLDFERTPQLLLTLGIKHDFTLGFNRHVGFRCGTGFPYSLYSFHTEKALDLLCHPLAFMDSSCFHEAKSNGQLFQSIFNDFFAQNKSNGNLVVNFHNQFFDTASYYDIPLANMYEELLRDFS